MPSSLLGKAQERQSVFHFIRVSNFTDLNSVREKTTAMYNFKFQTNKTKETDILNLSFT